MKKLPTGVLLLFLIAPFFCEAREKNTCAPPPGKNALFNYLTVNNGLSQNSVTSILQDKSGFIWIGTWDGINKYDGFTITVRRHESGNANSLTDNRVSCLYEDVDGNILSGTQSGDINIYNPVQNKFSHLSIKDNSSAGNEIRSICNDAAGNLWIGTSNGLRIKSKSDSNLIKLFPYLPVTKIVQDKDGNMWLGTNKGLFFSKAKIPLGQVEKNIVQIKEADTILISALQKDQSGNIWVGQYNQLSRITLSDNPPYNGIQKKLFHVFSGKVGYVTGIEQDKNGGLWVATDEDGIYQFNPNREDAMPAKHYSNTEPFCNLADNSVSTILIDRANVLWAGLYQKGVNYTNLSINNFQSFYPLLANQTGELGYKGKFVTAVNEDGKNLWIGTSNEGLFSYDLCAGKLRSYENIKAPSWVSVIFTAKNGTRWFGTSQGLFKISGNGGEPELQIKELNVHSIAEDRYENLWLTTWDGVFVYNQQTKKLMPITVKEGLTSNFTFLVYADPVFPIMWVSTLGSGLNRIVYNEAGKYTISAEHHNKENQAKSLTSNYIWSIYRDSAGLMWLGTDAGLDRVQLDKNAGISSISHVNHPLLKDIKILSILQDENHSLWLGNSQGLFNYNPSKNEVKHYSHKDGLQSNTFTEAAFKSSDGTLYFGGINGLNYFKPADIKDNPFSAQLAITGFKIFNQDIHAGEKINDRTVLEKDINNTEKITLSYKENNFLLTFASLHFALPENNRFRYKLIGYDKDWIVTNSTQRFAAYSNLPSGNYDFIITASNNDGQWNQQYRSIHFTVQPAPWATWWARTIYVLLAAAAVYFIVQHYQQRHQLKTQLYQEKLEKEKVTELNEMKLSFFTNITHELRTPLNLIIGPVKDLLAKSSEYDHFAKFRLDIIRSNSERLLSLINQVLDLRKVSSESNRLFISNGDIIKTVAQVKNSFNWLAGQKNIQYDFAFDMLSFAAWYDKDKVEKVVFNLLDNAFKHTPEGGKIGLDLTVESPTGFDPIIHLTFSDTGTGIDPAEMDKIFDMFYQGNENAIGTGIGLALSKKLIEIHHGAISVSAAEKGGAVFSVSFPVGLHRFKSTEIFKMPVEEGEPATILTDKKIKTRTAVLPKKEAGKKSILIIEDNEEQRAYIRENIFEQFEVYEAKDGDAGLEAAEKYLPDVILTDLMMPGMDGTMLCRKLKENSRTSHIPIIIHSVKNTGEAQKLALEAGANDFVEKPCDYRLLILKINNTLQSGRQLAANLYKENISTPSVLEVPDVDAVLLKQVITIIEENMSDPNFSVEMLSKEAAMSRMHLHRRINDITGKTTSELIREVKMKRASQLLKTGDLRIAEVMLEVGISNYNLFNKYFREVYGKTPREYAKGEEE